MADQFAADSVIREVSAEPALLLGAGRALLLQLAHPNVAQGVAEHSDFQHNPFKRLQGTLEAVYAVVFGSEALAAGVGRRIAWVHDHVTGPTYRANDPANLMWVHATLFDTALTCFERLLGPLSDDDRATYYEEMTRVAEVFGCPRDAQPADLAAFNEYFAEQVATLEVTDVARQLAHDIVRPTLPFKLHLPLAPALAVHRLLAIGLTPARLRDEFGFDWDDAADRRVERVLRMARATFRVSPRPLRLAPGGVTRRYLLWQAHRHTASHQG